MDVSSKDQGVFCFGAFRLDPTRRVLSRDGVPIKLAGRLFETLLYLVQNAGRLVEKDELLAAIWPDRIVEESNLTQAVSSLRKLLHTPGEGTPVIATVSGRGYRLAIEVRLASGASPAGFDPACMPAPTPPPRLWPPRRVVRAARLPAALLVCGLAIWVWSNGAGKRPPAMPQAVAFAPPPHSVAVLPFTNIGGTAANDYVSDGLSEEVIGTLGQLNQLRVASRTSSFGFRTGNLPIETIARRLNVATVLEGSIRWASTHLRVNAQLIDGRTGYQIWSKSYDREQGDVLHLETEIATEISKAMQVNLGQDDLARLDAVSTGNKQALDAYLRGIMLKRTLDPSKANETLAAFDQAVALDPKFIMARVLRARVLTQMAEGFGDATKDVRVARNYAEQAIAEAEQALSLDPNYAPAHDVLAVAAQLLWDFPRAASEFARARDLAGNDPAILRHYVTLQVYLGHADAMLAESRHAVALDPLSLQAHLELLHNLLWTHHADEAEAELHYAAQLNLSPAMLAFYRGRVAIARGDGATARAACQAASGYRKPYCLALAEHLLGHQADSEQQLAKFRAMYGDVGATLYANIYAQWGQKREALDWLETAYRSHDPGLQMLNIDPLLDPLRGEPGFVDLVRKMKFPA